MSKALESKVKAKPTKQVAKSKKLVIHKPRPNFHGVNLQGALAAIKKLKSVDVKSNYFDVKTGQIIKSDDTVQVQLDALKSAARSMLGHDHTRMWLWQDPVTYNGSAATALAVASGQVPANCSEWASVIALYDEIKVHSLHISISVLCSTGTTIGQSFAVVAYDSTRNSTPTSVADVMESPQHHLWVVPVVAGSIQPSIATTDGFQHLKVKIPSQSVANATPVTGGTGIVANFPGEWMSTLDTADSVGYFRMYIEAPTGSGSISVKIITGFDVELRERT